MVMTHTVSLRRIVSTEFVFIGFIRLCYDTQNKRTFGFTRALKYDYRERQSGMKVLVTVIRECRVLLNTTILSIR